MTENLEIVDVWAEVPGGVGPGPVSEYLATVAGAGPRDEPIVLPPVVTVMGRAGLQPVHSAR